MVATADIRTTPVELTNKGRQLGKLITTDIQVLELAELAYKIRQFGQAVAIDVKVL